MESVKCVRCSVEKPATLFAKCKAKKNGLQSYCRKCATEVRKNSKPYRYIDKEREREIQYKYKYGITSEMFESLWNNQSGLCAICCKVLRKADRGYAIDHNHETKKVRGLLCNQCNTGLGLLQDNPDILRSALDYLQTKGHYGRTTTRGAETPPL